MPRCAITFAQLQELLLDLGFAETVVPKSFAGFRHDASGAEIFLPIYKPTQIVAPRYLVAVRIMLDGKGLMDGDDFDEFTAAGSRTHRAS